MHITIYLDDQCAHVKWKHNMRINVTMLKIFSKVTNFFLKKIVIFTCLEYRFFSKHNTVISLLHLKLYDVNLVKVQWVFNVLKIQLKLEILVNSESILKYTQLSILFNKNFQRKCFFGAEGWHWRKHSN